jgi:hypothetical protein
VIFAQQPRFSTAEVAVVKPKPGVWRVRQTNPGARSLTVHAVTVHPVRLIHTIRIGPRGSPRRPVKHGQVLTLRWGSRGLSRRVRVSIFRSPRPMGLIRARRMKARLRASGTLRIPGARLNPGRNYFILVATIKGVPFQRVSFAGPVWGAARRHRPRR